MPKVLVTGGAGFLGLNACKYFREKGWDVVAYDNLGKFELRKAGYDAEKVRAVVLKELEKLGIEFYRVDISDFTFIGGVEGCDLVLNCAAQPTMTLAISDPQRDFTSNVMGAFAVLESCRKFHVPAVFCSTIHIYGNCINKRLEEKEDRLVGPIIDEGWPILDGYVSPLHASKAAIENYARAYIDTYGLKVAVFRLSGIYGPWQLGTEDHGWVANFAIRTIKGLPITIFGTDKQVRDIVYVEDVCRAFEMWYNKQVSGIYNIGGGPMTAVSLRQVLRMLSGMVGNEQDIGMAPGRPMDLLYFVGDINRAKYKFGWAPRVLPQNGLQWQVDWIQDNLELFEGVK